MIPMNSWFDYAYVFFMAYIAFIYGPPRIVFGHFLSTKYLNYITPFPGIVPFKSLPGFAGLLVFFDFFKINYKWFKCRTTMPKWMKILSVFMMINELGVLLMVAIGYYLYDF